MRQFIFAAFGTIGNASLMSAHVVDSPMRKRVEGII